MKEKIEIDYKWTELELVQNALKDAEFKLQQCKSDKEFLMDALLTALPFVEDCQGCEAYKPGAVSAALKKIHKVILEQS